MARNKRKQASPTPHPNQPPDPSRAIVNPNTNPALPAPPPPPPTTPLISTTKNPDPSTPSLLPPTTTDSPDLPFSGKQTSPPCSRGSPNRQLQENVVTLEASPGSSAPCSRGPSHNASPVAGSMKQPEPAARCHGNPPASKSSTRGSNSKQIHAGKATATSVDFSLCPSQGRALVEDYSEDDVSEELDCSSEEEEVEETGRNPATFSAPAPANGHQEAVHGPPPQPGTNPKPTVGKWKDLFTANRSSKNCPKLVHFSAFSNAKNCSLLDGDFDSNCELWKLCVVGYVAGKYPGFQALQSIIDKTWKCTVSLTIHDSGWLIYRFNNEIDKLNVLSGGPYLIYGRPLVLKPMPEFFNFAPNEMNKVPVWVKFPNLPLKCWSLKCLSKLASVLGIPIQCDSLTASLSRLSFARVLVELDLLQCLPPSINITLPNGTILVQPVIYETLPKFCKSCKMMGHTTENCSKASAASEPSNKPNMDKVIPVIASCKTIEKSSKVPADNNAAKEMEVPVTASCVNDRQNSKMVRATGNGNENAEAMEECLEPQVEAVLKTKDWEIIKGGRKNMKDKLTHTNFSGGNVQKDKAADGGFEEVSTVKATGGTTKQGVTTRSAANKHNSLAKGRKPPDQ